MGTEQEVVGRGEGVSIRTSVHELREGDGLRLLSVECVILLLTLSLTSDRFLVSFFRSLISRRNSDITLSLSSARELTEGE